VSWAAYRLEYLEPHITRRWINQQLRLAPPDAVEDEVAQNVEAHRETRRKGMRQSRLRAYGNHVVPAQESPKGGAVLAESGGDAVPPVAAAEGRTPQDDREGEDSGVTVHHPERAAAIDPERKPSEGRDTVPTDEAGSSSEANARQSALRNGARSSGTVPVSLPIPVSHGVAGGSPAPGFVTYYVDPNNPTSLLANGLAMAMGASLEMTPVEAASLYPKDIPLSHDISEFREWLYEFEEALGNRYGYGMGNDAAN